MSATVTAIILAAGQGQRIGQPKLFLESGGRTFLEAVLATLDQAGVRDVAVVTRGELLKRASELAPGRMVLANPDPERGMLSSLAIGVRESTVVDGYLIWPVDHPHVAARTVELLLTAFQAGNTAAKPVHRGRAGHPVIIPRKLARDLPAGDVRGGLAKVLADLGVPVELVMVDDPGILKNINEPYDLESWSALQDGIADGNNQDG